MSEVLKESIGRIEVAPEVLTTIARATVMRVEGIHKMASPPAEVAKLFRRPVRQDGVVLDWSNNDLKFEIYVIMDPKVNIVETSRALQKAVVEAIDKMVGIPVSAVNIHVENVVYADGQTA